ncbi:uncharacterized protein LOC123443332 [Hordeum vulgare subsp. vulgare]|uniref:uncharacterized protein LOC123443332 n=1 Tax=Hordeum vulgare subsp. vulgare TaxID=112509 RepID=UPI000B473D9F|nr:uncharacterized protein LOC123443332 [Hordeum vulgare subsp. vulgare]
MSQEEQCNGQGPAAEEPSVMENADVVPVLDDADDRSVQNISISEQGNLDHGSPRTGDGEDSTVKATNSDVGGDLIGAQPGEVDGEKLPISEESIMPQDSSQRDIADDGTNQVGVHQEVQMDFVERTSSSDSKETMEVPIPSLDLRADNANMGEEGTREMEVGVSGRSSDGNIQDVEPTVSGETGMEVGHEVAMGLAASQEIPGRGDTNDEANGVAKEAVQEDADTHELDLSVEKVDSALCGDAVSQGFMPYRLDEYIQRHLYVTTLSRDLLQLQLDEGTYLNSDVTLSSDEILKLQVHLKESEERKVAAHEEIQQCRHELTNLNTVKGELELIVASQKQEIDASKSKCEQLEIELQSSKENAQQILIELADCQSLLEALQKENIELTENLALEEKTRKQVEAQQEHLSGENEKLLSQLSDLELSLASVKEVMNAGSSRCRSLEAELCSFRENMEHTWPELTDCRALLETSQKDNVELSAKFAIESEANKKLKEDNVFLHRENERLSPDLSELNDKLHLSYARHKQLELHVRDMETHMEQLKDQLIEEILCATNSSDIYQSVIKELDAKCNVVLDQAEIVLCQSHEHRQAW